MNGAGIDIGTGQNPGGNNIVVQGTASTTNLTVSGLPNCNTTSALTTNASGVVSCGSISGGGGGAAFPFTPTTNFGALTNATGTPVWFQAGLQASSTCRFDFASTTGISAGVSAARRVFVGSDASNGLVQNFGGGLTLATDGAHTININSANTGNAQLSTSLLTTDRQFQFPDTAGTLCLTTTCGTVTAVSATYPIQSTGGATPVISLAFGTTTSNTWANAQTFNSGLYSLGTIALGSSSPYASLSIHANPTDTTIHTALFAIGSSTASATTSLFTIDNNGHVTIVGGTNGDLFNIFKSGAGTASFRMSNTGQVYANGNLSTESSILFAHQITMTGQFLHDDSPDTGGVNYFNGNNPFGIGTSTPIASFQATANPSNATTSIQLGKPNQNKGTCITYYDTAGAPVYGYFPAGSVVITYTSTKPSGCQN